MSVPTPILASQSPRRKELLGLILPAFSVQVSDADETLAPGTSPMAAVEQLALQKDPGEFVVIGSDTVVSIDGRILGKPHSREDCLEMLQTLSGREHLVHTGVALLRGEDRRVFTETAGVEFWPLSREEIDWYASTPEPYDKAGGYGVPGRASLLVRGVRGDYYTVMGLPVSRLWRELREFAPELFAGAPAWMPTV